MSNGTANGTAYTQTVQRCVKWLSVISNSTAGGGAGGMTSSNLKIGAKLSHGVVAVLKSLHFALPYHMVLSLC